MPVKAHDNKALGDKALGDKAHTGKAETGWVTLARILAAVPVNYVLTALIVACLARLLPTSPDEATIAATLASFVIFPVIVMAAFSVHSVSRLWAVMMVSGLCCGAVLWLSLLTGGRL